jgi:hypothetical protein
MSRVDEQYTDAESRFTRAFSHGGTLCAMDCACGRVHFVSADGHGDYDEGELDRLKEAALKDPDKYVEHSVFDTIHVCDAADGYIPQCPCGGAERIRKWIDDHAAELVTYLTALFEARKKKAESKAAECSKHLQALAVAAGN